MPDTIGNIPVPEIPLAPTPFPIVPDYPYGRALAPDVSVHQFGSGNAKVEQRFLRGSGARQFVVRKAWLSDSDRIALRTFWEARQGPYGAFIYNAPNDDGVGTTPVTCRFANEPLSWEMLTESACTAGVTLIEIPSATPSYTVDATATRVPPGALQAALLSQTQEIIPLIRIQPLQAAYPAIYVSDRRCTVGGQLYQARLLDFDGISQGVGGEADEASFTFGNADRVMRDLANDVDLFRAGIEFSLYHVQSQTKLDLWKGDIVNWSMDDGPEFRVGAADGLYELNLPYPTRKCSRTCGKPYDSTQCPYSSSGALDLVHFPAADPSWCDKGYDTPNGCLAHGMKRYYGAILAEPQGVRIKDNSTGTWGYGRSPLTSVSIVADSIYEQVLPEVYTDADMPVNCKVAAGRDESDFYSALGIVGEGPLIFGFGHKLDGQHHHGPGALGLRTVPGDDPAAAADYFSLDESGDQTGGDWRKVYNGASTFKDNFAAGTAFLTIRRSDPKGLQLSRPGEHQIEAVVSHGMRGWVWTDSGDHQAFTRSAVRQVLTNPLWIAVNMLLRARGVWLADAATQEQFFDVKALADSTLVNGLPKGAALVCDLLVPPLVPRTMSVWVVDDPETGDGHYENQPVTEETQFKFRGVMQEEKPLRDWLQEVLMNCLGFYTFSFGKLKLGVRMDSSVAEAFTEGNTLFGSLQLSPLRPSFNHLTANFADQEYEFVANSVTIYDKDHSAFLAGGAGPLFLKSNVNLAGASSKSQAGRIISVRLREELGGITPGEWKAARQLSFRTTVLALNTEPGMVCSMTHPLLPGGSGEFRVISWRLNPDYSIDIQGRTTTDSMYDLLVGPKPADVEAAPIPVEAVDPMPGDVRPFDDQPFEIAVSDAGAGNVALDVVYDPPDPIGSFAGVYAIITTPDGVRHFPGDHPYNGDRAGDAITRRGSCRFTLPGPALDEDWRVAICSRAATFRKEFVPHDAPPAKTPTPNRVVSVVPVHVPGGTPMPAAEKITGATVTLEYAVFTADDGAKSLKFRFHGSIARPEDSAFLHARIQAAGDGVLALGTGRDTFFSPWFNIEPGSYTLRFYSVNKENAETADFYEHPQAQVVTTMPPSPPITAPWFDYQGQMTEDGDGNLKHQWRLVGGWTQEISENHFYTRVQLRVENSVTRLLEKGGDDREYITDWFDMGAASTYQVEYVPYNRLEVPGDPAVAGSFTASPLGETQDVLAFQAGTFNEDTQQWSLAMSWDTLKKFMLIDWGCVLPQSTTNWSAVAVFIKVPNPNAPGGFDYVPGTGKMDRSMFVPSSGGLMTFYDRIAIELRHVPETPEPWAFIACSCDRAGNPKHDGDGKPIGPTITLNTLALEDQPDFNRPPDVTGLDFTTEVVAPGELDVVITLMPGAAPASGAQIYLERPTGAEPRERGSFDYIGTGQQTIKIRERGPEADEDWKVRVVSYSLNHAGKLRAESPSVTKLVSSYPHAPKVASGTAEVVVRDTETQKNGRFGFKGTYPVPISPYFEAVEAVAVYQGDTYEHNLGRTWEGAFETDLWPMPDAPVGVEIRLYSINHVKVRNPDYHAIAGLIVSPDGSLKFDKLPIPDAGIKGAHIDRANITIESFTGNLPIGRVTNLETITISSFAGNLDISRVENVGSINIGSLSGSLSVAQAGAININNFEGVLITQKLADGILNDLNKFAENFRPITKVAALPTLPHAAYPVGTVILLTSDSKLYKNFTDANWSLTTASDTITGKIASDDILTIEAGKLTGQINAARVTHIQVSQFSGTLSVAQCQSIAISTFWGNLDVSRVNNLHTLSITNFQGNLDVSRINNLHTLSIHNFQGNLDMTRVDNLGSFNIANFYGTLNVGTQLEDGSITSVKIDKLSISKLEAGEATFTGDVTLSRGAGSPKLILRSASVNIADDGVAGRGITLNSSADGAGISLNGGVIGGGAASMSSGGGTPKLMMGPTGDPTAVTVTASLTPSIYMRAFGKLQIGSNTVINNTDGFFTNIYLKTEVYSKTEAYAKTEVYAKGETYTRAEVDAAIAAAIAGVGGYSNTDIDNMLGNKVDKGTYYDSAGDSISFY